MPCQSEWPDETITRQSRELNRVTRVACELGKIARKCSLRGEISKEAMEWLEKHDALDAIRAKEAAQEKARKIAKRKALSKLSAADKAALGL